MFLGGRGLSRKFYIILVLPQGGLFLDKLQSIINVLNVSNTKYIFFLLFFRLSWPAGFGSVFSNKKRWGRKGSICDAGLG